MIWLAAPTAAQYDQTKLEEGPMSEAYVFYRHKAKPQYRLVLKEDAPFPSGTSPDQWVDQGHRLEDNVSEETCAEVARHGFKLYRLAASFEELQPSLDELKH
jgi:hypothetical protein